MLVNRWVTEDWKLLDLAHLDDSYRGYRNQAVVSLAAIGDYATASALDYMLTSFEQMGHEVRVDQTPRLLNDYARMDTILALLGPIRTKHYISQGWSQDDAFRAALRDTQYASTNYANDLLTGQSQSVMTSSTG